MTGLTLCSLGAAGTVTGSKHLLSFGGRRILVDCGLFQGIKHLRQANWAQLPIPASSIDAVILTHAHLDHSGYLPRLVRDGFDGPVFVTPGTADVAEIILRDSAHLQTREAEFFNRHRLSQHDPAEPLYDIDDVEAALRLFTAIPMGTPFSPVGAATPGGAASRSVVSSPGGAATPGGSRATFRGAGHILGAATVTIEWNGKTVVFTGDLGRYDDPLMRDPQPVRHADYLVTEATYGDRQHVPSDPAAELLAVVNRTVARGGTVVIPSFAVGRTQLILYYLWTCTQAGTLPDVPIYVDSPMAINAGELLRRHPDGHRLDPARTEEMFAIARYMRDVEQSKLISADRSPKIVISASGMATGGRILHHLEAFAPDARNTILLAGYQAVATRGRSLAQGAKQTKIFGRWVPVRAQVENLHSLSAHADSGELIRWMHGFAAPPKRTFIVHAEPQAAHAFRERLDHDLGWKATTSVQNQVYALD